MKPTKAKSKVFLLVELVNFFCYEGEAMKHRIVLLLSLLVFFSFVVVGCKKKTEEKVVEEVVVSEPTGARPTDEVILKRINELDGSTKDIKTSGLTLCQAFTQYNKTLELFNALNQDGKEGAHKLPENFALTIEEVLDRELKARYELLKIFTSEARNNKFSQEKCTYVAMFSEYVGKYNDQLNYPPSVDRNEMAETLNFYYNLDEPLMPVEPEKHSEIASNDEMVKWRTDFWNEVRPGTKESRGILVGKAYREKGLEEDKADIILALSRQVPAKVFGLSEEEAKKLNPLPSEEEVEPLEEVKEPKEKPKTTKN